MGRGGSRWAKLGRVATQCRAGRNGPLRVRCYARFMQLTPRFAVALGLTFAAAVGCSSKPEAARNHAMAPDVAAKLLIDRNWIDRMPATHSDRLHVFRFVPTMGGGVYQDRTLFKGSFELFVFKIKGETLDIVLPETHEHVTSQFTIEEVSGPAPFDLKLTLQSVPRGPQIYYGTRSETDRTGALLNQQLSALAAAR